MIKIQFTEEAIDELRYQRFNAVSLHRLRYDNVDAIRLTNKVN